MAEGLKLYNTLTRSKVDFTPIDPENVRMYVCGPTVYDFAHIGNARPVIVFDVLYRLLRHIYGENHVTYARNITDVDDKINARALRDFPDLPLNDAIAKVTQKTADQFRADVAALGNLPPTIEPRATDNIQQMIDIIKTLIAKGHAYVAEGEVLFDTRSMAAYGQLSKRNLDEQQAGARIAVEAHKKHPGDFVLWKLSSRNEPGWDSPWGRGRPGWHIECSAMSKRYLGEVFDIHGGGLDLIFPHHENEIAQSCCANDTSVMANVWMHNGFVQVEGRKMSKSDGNFFTINELLDTENFGGRKWPGEVLRLAMLMTHYRQPIDFSVSRLEEAESRLKKWKRGTSLLLPKEITPEPDDELVGYISDDLDTHKLFMHLDELSGYAEKDEKIRLAMGRNLAFLGLIKDSSVYINNLDNAIKRDRFKKYASPTFTVEDADTVEKIIPIAILDDLIEKRLKLLKEKLFKEADEIRKSLGDVGIQLNDGKDKETGERITTWEVKR
ncbi:cysteine--tRNA ligase [Agrobacterium vitis]|uniref:Cysteine--tRNA ligase n=1 Tax=Agrobacterium vitis TaxID=373 RepID=A0ABD6GIY1_AGRVI|nr:cysteine--tRNA ligase [Agrobacterium vitis]MUO81145.1 cysteine--tRNA ligase [Agrobacterium vitis]MUO95697.1 cysteine--tRNA ligase [Agrobacterium vitis]MUP06826.1 cysteine--tRNA ligase [Agrobacterium vitis]MUZ84606.1 cysteine--tRNA ligase [Agrobacterium vitis]MVA10515.1 cysteine--tRNA ligase [Agrobacterium vitis]